MTKKEQREVDKQRAFIEKVIKENNESMERMKHPFETFAENYFHRRANMVIEIIITKENK